METKSAQEQKTEQQRAPQPSATKPGLAGERKAPLIKIEETNRARQRQTETDRAKQKETETDRDKQRQTETDRD